MAVLNVTPDSFSDGGRYQHLDAALRHAEQLIIQGTDILDVGGESTRPGSRQVGIQEELDRVIPVLEALYLRFSVSLSIDTSRTEVMREAVSQGAELINDVNALQAAGAVELVAKTGVAVCLMHKKGQPDTMQLAPAYRNVTVEVKDFLRCRLEATRTAGIDKRKILLDPGFGFGKTLDHNLQLLRELASFDELGCPILVGLSRKSMLGAITGRAVEDRLVGSAALALLAVQNGAAVVRVHDVAATQDVLAIWRAVRDGE
ncbi:MAG TPA: dihydropteroate synthase [Gammaproteobacteria bacterium]|nr:dihydropteroate synthase [Gammaproteobacteria bacterium]